MSFLNLWALWLAAIAVPALLILYFLKLRRREELVPTTLLWKRAVQDLQVNAPFQRLRKNLLLFLQLLVLALAILALARPIVQSAVTDEDRLVLLIDRSASMNTMEPDGRTRLAHAKEQARRLVQTLNRGKRGWRSLFSWTGSQPKTQAMVMAFADRASIVSPFTTNTGELVDLIDRIEPTDGRTYLEEPLKLAEAYMAPPTMLTAGMESTPVSAETPSRVVIISDGRIADLDQAVLRGGKAAWIPIGSATDNVGITALRAQRNYERPELLSVFLTAHNQGPVPVETDVRLYVDGVLITGRPVKLGPRPPNQPVGEETGPSAETNSAALSFDLPLDRGGVLEARLRRDDMLMVDNVAYAVVPPPRKLRVLVVTEKNRLLDFVLSGLPLAEYPFITPQQWEANPGNQYTLDGQATYDVVVFDKVQPKRLPAGSYLFFKAVPALEGVSPGAKLENHALIWWDETHPVLRYVGLDYVYVYESLPLKLPPEAEVLVEGPQGPVVARYARDGRNTLMCGFAVEESNLWSKQAFAVFMYNAIRYLGGGAEAEEGAYHPGQTLAIPIPPGKPQAELVRPDKARVTLKPDAAGISYYGGTEQVGTYRVEQGTPGRDRFAVNLEDRFESDITPVSGSLNAAGIGPVTQMETIRTATPEVWRWFVGAALLLVFIEWWVYNRRVMV